MSPTIGMEPIKTVNPNLCYGFSELVVLDRLVCLNMGSFIVFGLLLY